MKFSCSKDALDKQLQYISRIITTRSTVPVLSNVLLETDGQILRLSGTDLDLTITTHLPAQVEQEGTFTVPAKVFQEFVHQNPDETLHFNLESYELVCTSNKVSARLSGMDSDEFPALPRVEKGKVFTLSLPEFVESMKKVVIACALDASRPALTAVQAIFEKERAIFVATDSFRLVEKKVTTLPTQEGLSMLLPARTIQEIIRISAVQPEVKDLGIEVSESQIVAKIGTVEVYSRLITGNFPKYQSIIPQTFMTIADVTTSELVQALRLSSIFSQGAATNILIEINDQGEFSIATHGSQRGSTKHTIYALLQEGFSPMQVPFNARFLIDACTATGSTHVQLRFSGPSKALVIGTDDPNYLQLVMPIRMDT